MIIGDNILSPQHNNARTLHYHAFRYLPTSPTQVPASPPEIIGYNDARALLYHARDGPTDDLDDTPAVRAAGWKKICLFALYFQSSPLRVRSR